MILRTTQPELRWQEVPSPSAGTAVKPSVSSHSRPTPLWNGGTGNNTDQFYINSTVGDPDLARISFYSTSFHNSFLGDGYQIMGGGFANQIIPVPEPETYATAVLLLLIGVFWS